MFDLSDTSAYAQSMSTLRLNIIKLLAEKNWSDYDLEKASGVPQPTINRFISGKHNEPRGSTVRKLAKGLNVTEAELRGLVPIENIDTVKNDSLKTKENELPSTISEGNQMIRLSEQEGAINVLVSKHDAKIIEALKLLTYEQKTDQENAILQIADANKAIYLALSKNNFDTK